VSVDLATPRIRVTDPLLSIDTFATPPDSVRGWTWDRNGVQAPVLVSYAGDNGFFGPIATTRSVADTVFFTIPFADSISGDGTYTLVFRAGDVVGRTQDFQFVINVDNLAPGPPILNARGGLTSNPKLRLFPTLDADATLVNFYVNDIFDTSVQAVSLPYEITLSPGVTRVKATAEDQAGNVSGFSNEITVEFEEPEQGVVIPQPFEPDDVFIINLKKAAATTTLNIYDLNGNLVETLSHNQLTKKVRIPWDGVNGAGVPARRGPLVAVFQLVFADGSKHVTREIFVFRQR